MRVRESLRQNARFGLGRAHRCTHAWRACFVTGLKEIKYLSLFLSSVECELFSLERHNFTVVTK